MFWLPRTHTSALRMEVAGYERAPELEEVRNVPGVQSA
jgi:hypothetical protein